ncbi:MAG TPA: hypothetical protein VFV38_35190 [Ktedonobacteraceae bacterium]|nr:hypothetical protein [Ktedonobacteraceae bacterium]
MHSPHIEERAVTSLTALALDIAQQLDDKHGKTVVVCEHPAVIASLVSKKWHQRQRPLLRDYATTLDTHKRQELWQHIAWMRSLVFSAVGFADQLETSKTDVLFCTAQDLLRYAPVCQAMYITYPIGHKDLHLITAWMQPEDTVTCYRIAPKAKRRMVRVSVDYGVRYIEAN